MNFIKIFIKNKIILHLLSLFIISGVIYIYIF